MRDMLQLCVMAVPTVTAVTVKLFRRRLGSENVRQLIQVQHYLVRLKYCILERRIEMRYVPSGDGGDGKIPRTTNCCPAGTRPVKNIEKMCVSPGDGRVTGDGSASKSDGKALEKTRREKGVIKPQKKKGSKPKNKKGARRKARRRAKSKR